MRCARIRSFVRSLNRKEVWSYVKRVRNLRKDAGDRALGQSLGDENQAAISAEPPEGPRPGREITATSYGMYKLLEVGTGQASRLSPRALPVSHFLLQFKNQTLHVILI